MPALKSASMLRNEDGTVLGGTGKVERQQLAEALHAAGGNQSQAARMLGINRVTVWNRMRKYELKLKREINP